MLLVMIVMVFGVCVSWVVNRLCRVVLGFFRLVVVVFYFLLMVVCLVVVSMGSVFSVEVGCLVIDCSSWVRWLSSCVVVVGVKCCVLWYR